MLMPYKNIEDRRACSKRHYNRNVAMYVKKAADSRKRIKDFLDNYKSTHPCTRCSENDPVCLEFHHTDPKAKEIEVSRCVLMGWSIKRILKEIAKCIILCANCHKKEHFKNKANLPLENKCEGRLTG